MKNKIINALFIFATGAMSFVLGVILCESFALAQSAINVGTQPTWGDGIVKYVGLPATATLLIGITEGLMRIWPTAKPWSWLVPVKYALGILSAILGSLIPVLDAIIASANRTAQAPTPVQAQTTSPVDEKKA